MSQGRGLLTKGHAPKEDLVAEEVLLGQLMLNYVVCSHKTRCDQ